MNTKDMFYPEGTTFSIAEEKAFAREEIVYNVTEDLLVILEDMELSKKDLAKKLGKSKSYVSQVLSGARNMTLGTLSDICFAIGIKPKISLPVGEAHIEAHIVDYQNDKFSWEEMTIPQKPSLIDGGVIIYRSDPANWQKEVA